MMSRMHGLNNPLEPGEGPPEAPRLNVDRSNTQCLLQSYCTDRISH